MTFKICGIRDAGIMAATLAAGADMVGLNFVAASPRHVPLAVAAELAEQARGRALVVALVVDADDETLLRIRDVIDPDLFQLHGREDAERIREVQALTDRPAMKVAGVAEAADLAGIPVLAQAAARILLDAKPPKGAAYPGGHGRPFDWALLSALPAELPFMLSGGLTPDNVGEAIRTVRGLGLRLSGVDVASGVESAPGLKDPAKIAAFVANARQAFAATM
jgi:phosphoribosylanthranilate isomerase